MEDKDRVECLERDVKFWSDFSKVHFHPKSLYELNGTWTDFQKFDNFGVGKEIFSGGLHMEELNDRLRFFVEECDHMQGIQCLVDDSGGFSGVASEFLENIADDYTNIPVLLYAVRDTFSFTYATNQRKSITRSLHDAVSLSKLSTYSSLVVPVGLPSLGMLMCTVFFITAAIWPRLEMVYNNGSSKYLQENFASYLRICSWVVISKYSPQEYLIVPVGLPSLVMTVIWPGPK